MTNEKKPKTWGEMTDAEKGALLLAHHEGKKIQNTNGSYKWEWKNGFPTWADDFAYRVKPEPKRETVTHTNFHELARGHSITFDIIDGEPDCDSIRMERVDD